MKGKRAKAALLTARRMLQPGKAPWNIPFQDFKIFSRQRRGCMQSDLHCFTIFSRLWIGGQQQQCVASYLKYQV